MSQVIKDALAKLDPSNDDHWTSEGLPRLDVVKEFLGYAASRADITSAAKTFTRKTPNLDAEQPENTGDGVLANESETSLQTQDQDQDQDEEEPKAAALTSDDLVAAELDEALHALHEAQNRVREAQKKMDVVILRKQRQNSQVTTAETIKQYQASQFKQRQDAADRRQRMVDAMSADLTKV